jgi:hypothetical protein
LKKYGWLISLLFRIIEMSFWFFLLLKVKHFKVLLECHVKLVMIVNLFIGFYQQAWGIEVFHVFFISIGSRGRRFPLISFNCYWICSRSLPFNKTSHLFNSWNENKPVKIGRDGQVVQLFIYRLFFKNFLLRKLNHVVLKLYVGYFHRIHRLI